MNDFTYLQPTSLKQATGWLKDGNGAAMPNGGGTDLLDLMKNRIATPSYVVNLKSVPDLNTIRINDSGLELGALVTLTEIAEHPDILKHYTVLAEAAGAVASPQLRNVGTIGGNLCQRPRCWYFRGDFDCLRKGGDLCYAMDGQNKHHCIVGGGPCYYVHPSDPAVALMALGASVTIQGPKSQRTIPLESFFVLPDEDVTRETVLQPGEVVTAVKVPAPTPGTVSHYVKFTERAAWDFAVVSVAAVLHHDGGTVQGGRVALGGVAPMPWLEKNVTSRLPGLTQDDTALQAIADATLPDAEPLEMNGYKVILARNLVKRTLEETLA